MSINEDVGDLVTSHRLGLLRYEAGTTKELLKAYDGAFAAVSAEMDRLYAKIQAKESLDYRQLGRLGALKADLTRRIAELHRIAKATLGERLTEAANAERALIEGRLSRKIGVNLGAVPEEQVALMVAAPLGGQRWADRLAVDLFEAHTDVQRTLAQALASGQSIPHMAAALRRGTDIIETYRGRFVSIARTEVQRVANDAAMASYALSEDVIGAVQWLATLDSRTCLLCAPLHNKVYPLKNGVAVGLERPPPKHPRCRCFMSPVVKSYDEIGVKVRGDPKGYDGRPALDTSFDTWLKRQDADPQRDVLGAGRYDLWKAGKFDLADFAENGKVLKVGELVARANGWTTPSMPPDPARVPRGVPEVPGKRDDERKREALRRQNEAASVLARAGFDVELQPPAKGLKRPDYRVEGRYFDCIAPQRDTSPNNVWSRATNKVEREQTNRVVFELSRWRHAVDELRAVSKEFPNSELHEVFIVVDGTWVWL